MIEISGFTLTPSMWLIGWGVLAVIGLVAVGIIKSNDFDDETFGMSFGVVAISCIWPIILVIAVFIGIFAIPVYIGKYIGKTVDSLEKRKKEKLKNMSNVDKILKKKEVD